MHTWSQPKKIQQISCLLINLGGKQQKKERLTTQKNGNSQREGGPWQGYL